MQLMRTAKLQEDPKAHFIMVVDQTPESRLVDVLPQYARPYHLLPVFPRHLFDVRPKFARF
jgi:hypothetical protein